MGLLQANVRLLERMRERVLGREVPAFLDQSEQTDPPLRAIEARPVLTGGSLAWTRARRRRWSQQRNPQEYSPICSAAE